MDEDGVVTRASGYVFAAHPELLARGAVRSGTAAEEGQLPVWRDYFSIKRVAPKYPRRALVRGIQGAVVTRFCITPPGEPGGVEVVDESPPGVFAEAAIEAVRQFRYAPRIVLGKPVEVCGIENRLGFGLE